MTEDPDPILDERKKIAGWVSKGLRTGYGLFATASALFLIGVIFGFTSPLTTTITFCLFVGSAILAPSMVFNYGVKAANRADRDGTW